MNEQQEIATTEYRDDVYTAVQDGDKTHIYGPDGDRLITYFANAGNTINGLTLRLIVSAYSRGFCKGEVRGEIDAQANMRRALGL